MKKFNKTYLLCLLLALFSCTKEQITVNSEGDAMLFGVEGIAESKLVYGSQENGGISAKFEEDDKIGLYAFYNNFYYYYTQYSAFAESVIFANQGLTITSTGSASYSPLKTWTFSTIYGTAPHTLDAIAYYPFREGYNDTYVNLVHDSSGAAFLEYYYVYDENKVNSNLDFMTAHTRYDDSQTPDNFRSDMLALTHIPLTFTRQMASLNLQVTKPDDYDSDLIVTGLTVYFDANTKFTQTVNTNSEITWSGMTENYSLTASVTCNVALAKTGWDDTPSDGASNEVDNLLEDEDRLFFPPNTLINKIVFTLDGIEDTYTWHPHITTIEANTHYTLNLELDPSRAN